MGTVIKFQFSDNENDDLLDSIPEIEGDRRVAEEPAHAEEKEKKRFAFDSAVSTHRIPTRLENGDAWLCDKEAGLYAVLDGIGAGGMDHMASQRAAQSLTARIRTTRKLEGLIPSGSGNPRLESQRLHAAINSAHEEIRAINGKVSGGDPTVFGCSAVVVLTAASHMVVGWLGNARLYRMRGGDLKQLTVDHTLATLQLLFGLINEVEAQLSPAGQNPNCYLGANGAVDSRIKALEPEAGDRYLLCSYSLSRALGERRIKEAMKEPQIPSIASEWLVKAAAHVEPFDDITAIVIDVKEK